MTSECNQARRGHYPQAADVRSVDRAVAVPMRGCVRDADRCGHADWLSYVVRAVQGTERG